MHLLKTSLPIVVSSPRVEEEEKEEETATEGEMRSLKSGEACYLSLEHVLVILNGDLRMGLSSDGVAQKQKSHGANAMDEEEEEPLWRKFLDKLKEPMIALLLASAGISLLTGQYDDALSIAIAVIIVVTVAFVQEYKSDQSLAALSKLAPPR